MNLSDASRMGIFLALAEKLKKDNWIPAPGWWMQEHPAAEQLWQIKEAEEKLGAWISAPDDDYIALAEFLLERALKTKSGRQTLRNQGYDPEAMDATPQETLIEEITRRSAK